MALQPLPLLVGVVFAAVSAGVCAHTHFYSHSGTSPGKVAAARKSPREITWGVDVKTVDELYTLHEPVLVRGLFVDHVAAMTKAFDVATMLNAVKRRSVPAQIGSSAILRYPYAQGCDLSGYHIMNPQECGLS